MECLAPLVRARRAFVDASGKKLEEGRSNSKWELVSAEGEAYLDSLLRMELEGKGRLGEEELVTLCSKVMSADTDTSATMLEWAMLHLVLDQVAQQQRHRHERDDEGMDTLRCSAPPLPALGGRSRMPQILNLEAMRAHHLRGSIAMNLAYMFWIEGYKLNESHQLLQFTKAMIAAKKIDEVRSEWTDCIQDHIF